MLTRKVGVEMDTWEFAAATLRRTMEANRRIKKNGKKRKAVTYLKTELNKKIEP